MRFVSPCQDFIRKLICFQRSQRGLRRGCFRQHRLPPPPPRAHFARLSASLVRTASSRARKVPEPARPALPIVASLYTLPPLHKAHLLHLLVSLSFACHALAVLSYLLSPSHVLVFVLRVALLFQFINPRRGHPTRSLRFFVLLWAVQALCVAAVHAVTGSQGTKGPRGHAQGGLVLDFVGQAATPPRLHLVAIDIALALFQLATILIAFGATIPNDLDASTGGEGARDYSSVLGVAGVEGLEEDDEEGEGEGGGSSRAGARRRRGYDSVPFDGEDDVEEELYELDAEADALGLGSLKPTASSSSSLIDPSTRYIRLPLIADLRLRTVWADVCKSAQAVGAEREDAGMRGLEEGRGGHV